MNTFPTDCMENLKVESPKLAIWPSIEQNPTPNISGLIKARSGTKAATLPYEYSNFSSVYISL